MKRFTICLISCITIHARAANVTLSNLDNVIKDSATNITIALSEPSELRLTIRRTTGTAGAAYFISGATTELSIAKSSVITLQGVASSSMTNNMILEVLDGTNVLAFDTFTVTDSAHITFDQAVGIAYKSIEGNAPTSEISSTEVILDDDTQFVVTFYCSLPEGMFGPDYVAMVVVDAVTGEIISAWLGI